MKKDEHENPIEDEIFLSGSSSSSSSLQSDDILETTAALEVTSLADNTPAVKESFEEEDSKENVAICVGGSVSTSNADLLNHSHKIERSNTLSFTDSSEVKDAMIGGSTGIATECSIDNASVPSPSQKKNVDEKEPMPVDHSAGPSSHVDSVEVKSTNNCMEKTGKTKSVENLSSRLNGRHSTKPLFAPGFLDRHSQNNKSFKGREAGKAPPVKHGQELSNCSISIFRNGRLVSPRISVRNNNDVNSGFDSTSQKRVRFADELNLS